MKAMETRIVSDVHLGSRHCLIEEFLRFLAELPDNVTLVLNGDTADFHTAGNMPPRHLVALQRLREESLRRRVVWVRGNHDVRYVLPDPRRIEFVPDFAVGKRLYVSHGYDFDNIMPYHRAFIILFRIFHHVRVRLGAPSVHVAYYAKKFRFLYRILQNHVAMNAVEHAKENGFEAATCGHTHTVEDRIVNGIRYLNTGAWTERPLVYLSVTDDRIAIITFSGVET